MQDVDGVAAVDAYKVVGKVAQQLAEGDARPNLPPRQVDNGVLVAALQVQDLGTVHHVRVAVRVAQDDRVSPCLRTDGKLVDRHVRRGKWEREVHVHEPWLLGLDMPDKGAAKANCPAGGIEHVSQQEDDAGLLSLEDATHLQHPVVEDFGKASTPFAIRFQLLGCGLVCVREWAHERESSVNLFKAGVQVTMPEGVEQVEGALGQVVLHA